MQRNRSFVQRVQHQETLHYHAHEKVWDIRRKITSEKKKIEALRSCSVGQQSLFVKVANENMAAVKAGMLQNLLLKEGGRLLTVNF